MHGLILGFLAMRMPRCVFQLEAFLDGTAHMTRYELNLLELFVYKVSMVHVLLPHHFLQSPGNLSRNKNRLKRK